jgi:hypothetical protein
MPMTLPPRMLFPGWMTSAGSNDRNSITAMVLEGILAMQASTSTTGPLWRVTAHHHSTKFVYWNTNCSGYIWVDPEQMAQAAASAENTVPLPLFYAGVLLGLLSVPDAPMPVVPTIPSPAKSNLTKTLLPQPITPFKAYSIPSFFITVYYLKSLIPHALVFSSDPLFRVNIKTDERTIFFAACVS